MSTRFSLAILGLAAMVAAGCGDSYSDPLTPPKRQIDPGRYGVVMEDPLESRAAPAAPRKEEKPAVPKKTEKPAEKPQETVREEAKAGVGEKGRGYGGGIVTEPVRVYFHARERITFDQVKHNLDLYKALNGSGPKTTEEFMEKVVKANGTQLPDLPDGYRYIYDPVKEELMVEHPK
jgi:hypothetical protein